MLCSAGKGHQYNQAVAEDINNKRKKNQQRDRHDKHQAAKGILTLNILILYILGTGTIHFLVA